MPEKDVIKRARRDAEEGKSPSTQAGEFVREEFEHVREGKHGARSRQQAIAIGLSKARRASIKLPPPKKGRASGVNTGSSATQLGKRQKRETQDLKYAIACDLARFAEGKFSFRLALRDLQAGTTEREKRRLECSPQRRSQGCTDAASPPIGRLRSQPNVTLPSKAMAGNVQAHVQFSWDSGYCWSL